MQLARKLKKQSRDSRKLMIPNIVSGFQHMGTGSNQEIVERYVLLYGAAFTDAQHAQKQSRDSRKDPLLSVPLAVEEAVVLKQSRDSRKS